MLEGFIIYLQSSDKFVNIYENIFYIKMMFLYTIP